MSRLISYNLQPLIGTLLSYTSQKRAAGMHLGCNEVTGARAGVTTNPCPFASGKCAMSATSATFRKCKCKSPGALMFAVARAFCTCQSVR